MGLRGLSGARVFSFAFDSTREGIAEEAARFYVTRQGCAWVASRAAFCRDLQSRDS